MERPEAPYRLEMAGIYKSFPGVQALNNVSLQVRAGEIHALVGENGAGKSTLMKILSGAYRADAGSIQIDGDLVEIHQPADALRHGIVMIYQESSLSQELSVAENIFCGRLPRVGPFVDWTELYAHTEQVLARFNANIAPRTLIKRLSPAQCQMVEIAKALSMSAKIIVFDEPTAALTRSEVETLFQVMRSLKAEGIAIIFITHRLAEIFLTADRITVLRDGVWVTSEDVSQVNEEQVILSMVGRAVGHSYTHTGTARAETLLELVELTGKGFSGVSLHVHPGEVVGLFGLIGSGRTELMRALFGADRVNSGVILLDGLSRRFASPGEAVNVGIVLVPEDRKSQGLVLGMPIRNNISLPSLWSLTRLGFIQNQRESEMAESYRQRLDIRCPSIATRVLSLSGGNQQKVVIAKWLAKNPKLLIVDEPTRGIDVGAKAEVHHLILELAQQGVGVLMVSSELLEVLGVSDRIYVMHEGRLAGEVSREQATEELIMSYASGQKVETAS